MCFSAAASFATAALVFPVGLGAVQRCRAAGRSDLLPLAAIPLGFSLQQVLEGLVWHSLARGETDRWITPLALAYLGFAYGLWPAWIPWSGLCAARDRVGPARRAALRLLLGLGALMGLALWLPLLADPARARPVPVAGSLHYGAFDLLRGTPLAGAGPFLYLLVIAVPLLLVPSARVRWFAASLSFSSLLAHGLWEHAFSSVWCFFSALLSLQILWIVRSGPEARHGGAAEMPA